MAVFAYFNIPPRLDKRHSTGVKEKTSNNICVGLRGDIVLSPEHINRFCIVEQKEIVLVLKENTRSKNRVTIYHRIPLRGDTNSRKINTSKTNTKHTYDKLWVWKPGGGGRVADN